jgi:GNAT superfamily N-acetyltransferase
MRQNLPDPVPVIILARLAVDLRRQRQGIGAGLLKDAIERALALHREVGFRGLLVHALDDEAVAFYAKYDFVPCATIDQRTLILPIETAISA